MTELRGPFTVFLQILNTVNVVINVNFLTSYILEKLVFDWVSSVKYFSTVRAFHCVHFTQSCVSPVQICSYSEGSGVKMNKNYPFI